jgi:alanyl-tRNA synthetase
MNITSNEIRQKYLEFFEKKGHKIVPSSPLIPENDPTTLFTGSGMQPMVPYLL